MSAARRMAALPAAAALASLLDLLLWPRLTPEVRAKLAGKRVELALTDRGVVVAFAVRRWGFVPRLGLAAPDLRIAAAARDFGALAAGEEDADTLYFARRLVVEGDTETALLVKNTLDALEAGRGRRFARAVHRAALARRARRGRRTDGGRA